MATYSTGVTASFNGSPITELTGLSFSWGGGHSESRGGAWKPVLGQVQIETLAGASTSDWATRGTLVLSGGGISLTATAVCTEVGAVPEINGLTQYSYTFDLIG